MDLYSPALSALLYTVQKIAKVKECPKEIRRVNNEVASVNFLQPTTLIWFLIAR
jgi:hypothetical protein